LKIVHFLTEKRRYIMITILLLTMLHACGQGTFSIVAIDPETDEYGVAVASRVPDVGYIVPWITPGVGAVATQALSNPYFGPWALELLEEGKSADEVLAVILQRDTMPEQRQVGIVDREGRAVAHTGAQTLDFAGHRTAQYVTVQGNILTGPEVIDSMMATFKSTAGPLATRLLAALQAGERAGGDRRGKQSAALYVFRKHGGYLGVDDRLVDIKVLDHTDPVTELSRLYDMWQYAFMAPAYLQIAEAEKNDVFLERTYALLIAALQSDLDDPEVYNSLAWEFALKKKYPKETLEAAKRAHELAPEEAHIIDTLAEAYYAAGDYKNAVMWEERALEKEPENEFYIQQLEKFRKALGKK
jgi:uncharacterized Ntn-hydrolase superfamily protein